MNYLIQSIMHVPSTVTSVVFSIELLLAVSQVAFWKKNCVIIYCKDELQSKFEWSHGINTDWSLHLSPFLSCICCFLPILVLQEYVRNSSDKISGVFVFAIRHKSTPPYTLNMSMSTAELFCKNEQNMSISLICR